MVDHCLLSMGRTEGMQLTLGSTETGLFSNRELKHLCVAGHVGKPIETPLRS